MPQLWDTRDKNFKHATSFILLTVNYVLFFIFQVSTEESDPIKIKSVNVSLDYKEVSRGTVKGCR